MTKYGTDSSSILPPALVDRVKAEFDILAREGRTRTFYIECRSDQGVPHSARLRSRESVFEISLST